ncbi:MAG: hypothetical protein J6Y02_14460 [Pseudobutyrivibrio sp.]|nr:hypothetical protein [Pseudobutyrivibrio sp.]
MDFNPHYNLVGQHAFLSASKYHWINYSEEKLSNAYLKYLAIQRGTQLHELAHSLISLGVKLPKSKKTLNMYVNDAIGFKMTPEQPLYFSENCFGTADVISFKNDFLRIHDLKTGETPASMHQLEIYFALFCLEYGISPSSIGSELRIYQSDQIIFHSPEPEDIRTIMDKIIIFDQRIEKLKMEE